MVIAFCGHSYFINSKDLEEKLLDFLENKIGDQRVEMFLGGYGLFDSFAYDCCCKFKKIHNNVSLVLVTPYLTESWQRNVLSYQKNRFDEIIYPEIEDKPKKFAIVYRNRFMVDKADCIVAYVTHNIGGAYSMLKYAKQKHKEIFNLADVEL